MSEKVVFFCFIALYSSWQPFQEVPMNGSFVIFTQPRINDKRVSVWNCLGWIGLWECLCLVIFSWANSGGKGHPECGQSHFMGWIVNCIQVGSLREQKQVSEWTWIQIHFSLLLTVDVLWLVALPPAVVTLTQWWIVAWTVEHVEQVIPRLRHVNSLWFVVPWNYLKLEQ